MLWGRKKSSVASPVWHVEPSCWNQLLPKSSSSIITITISIDCNGLSLLSFEEKWLNYASGLKSAITSDSFGCVVFCAPNSTIFLVYIPAKSKMKFIWKDNFFCKIGFLCKSIAGPFSQRCSSVYTTIFVQRKDEMNYLSNQTSAKYYHSQNKH